MRTATLLRELRAVAATLEARRSSERTEQSFPGIPDGKKVFTPGCAYARRSAYFMQLCRRGFYAVTAIAVATVWPMGAQTRPTREAAAFRADSNLVLVPVTVIDRHGAIVSGLKSEAFTLTEDGVRQQIRSFAREDVPVSLGIVMDLSRSMKSVLHDAKVALRVLVKIANPGDEGFLNSVSTSTRANSAFTADFDEILSKVAFESAAGDTALIDTIYESLRQLRGGVHTRRALLVISDGMDNHSRHSKGELLELAMERRRAQTIANQ